MEPPRELVFGLHERSRLRTDFALVELDLRPNGDLGEALSLLAREGHRIQGMESDLSEGGASYQLEVPVPPGRELEPAWNR